MNLYRILGTVDLGAFSKIRVLGGGGDDVDIDSRVLALFQVVVDVGPGQA